MTDFPTENNDTGLPSQKEQTDHQDTTFHDILDYFFAALTNRRRRCVLAYLSTESSDSATMQELVEDIAAREHGNKTDSLDEIEITLFHHHLPKLADSGLIEFDKQSKTIRYRDDPQVESLLTYLEKY
ncbi:ArsR/SmtB family transcription factor [Haladaptatus pallidirubidus]|uniref:DUF7344 domain-containing protein n=1 Tax=Haladaptatus pallidirubidus TaxID=1008152 RepID=A0AAV3UIN3_9EURY|nr:hypothetical protein [Haladaptatus pallidirubidus]